MVARLPGWEARFNAVLADAVTRPYVLGVHDCFRLACAVVAALTGVDRWPAFAGTYSTPAQALRRIAAHGSSFEAAASWFFGGPAIPVALARRADIVCYRHEDDTYHLGVMTGAQFVVLTPEGLAAVPRSTARAAWRVG